MILDVITEAPEEGITLGHLIPVTLKSAAAKLNGIIPDSAGPLIQTKHSSCIVGTSGSPENHL